MSSSAAFLQAFSAPEEVFYAPASTIYLYESKIFISTIPKFSPQIKNSVV
jgi:hypothetical protein